MTLRPIDEEEIIENLNVLQNMSKEFHIKFVTNLKLSDNLSDLLNFRGNILITLCNFVNSLFKDDRIIQMYYNSLHAVFTLSSKYDFTVNMEDEKFRYFFYASLFLVSKFENKDYFRCFHQKAIKENMNLSLLYEIEKTILEEIKKIYYFSPDEISKIIVEGLRNLLDKEKTDKINECFNVFIYYALSEFEIYTRFDQFTLSFACLYISIKNEDSTLISALDSLIYKMNIDKVELLMCVNYIETQLNSTKEEEDIECMSTKANSSSNVSSGSKENIKKSGSIRRSTHQKINKLVTLHSEFQRKNQCDSKIHYCYKNKKLRLVSRQKSI